MDIERLVELATKAILDRLNAGSPASVKKVAAFGKIPEGLISGAEVKPAETGADIEGCDFIVMSAEAFYQMRLKDPAGAVRSEQTAARTGGVIDLSGKKLIHERDLRDANAVRGDLIKVSKNAIVTALAYDYAKSLGVKLTKD